MEIKFCRDCANFEERRDIDNAVLCKNHQGPYVNCRDFKPLDKNLNEEKMDNLFCLNCKNFQEIYEFTVCARNHIPGIACPRFTDKSEKSNVVKLNDLKKNDASKPIPNSLVKTGKTTILTREV